MTSSIQEQAASNCDVTMTDCSRVVAMDAFLEQWNRKFITAQWSTENTSCFNFFVYFFLNFVTPVFQHGASLVFINDYFLFRKFCSLCMTLMVTVNDSRYGDVDHIVRIFPDFYETFDIVDHKTLSQNISLWCLRQCIKIYHCGVSDSALKYIIVESQTVH